MLIFWPCIIEYVCFLVLCAQNMGDEITISNFREAVRTKGMWGGKIEAVLQKGLEGLTADGKIVQIKTAQSLSALKSIDELIVNASDVAKSKETGPAATRVTAISAQVRDDGLIVISNNGCGIPIKLHEKMTADSGRDIYVPEVAFTVCLAGSNIVKNIENVKGGTNGLGAKIANYNSKHFTVKTCDGLNIYEQTWFDGMLVTKPPTIQPNIVRAPQHTIISFLLDYEHFKYPKSAANLADIANWVRLRMHQIAAYLPAVNVKFNGELCATKSAEALGRLYDPGEDTVVCTAQFKATEAPYKQNVWQLAIVLPHSGKKIARSNAAQNITIINGVLTSSGPHIDYIKSIIAAQVEKEQRKFSQEDMDRKATLFANMRIILCAAIPMADWSGQRKDELSACPDVLSKYKISPATQLKVIAAAMIDRILIGQSTKKMAKVVHDKYTKAENAGGKMRQHTGLMVAEGDSAIALLKEGMGNNRAIMTPGAPNNKWWGIISLQGVTLNAAREITEHETASGAGSILVRSARLDDCKRLNALADAFGLSYDKKYETAAELATLNYHKLILCVDQDLDGTGKIAPLVLVWLYKFWPALIAAGRVGRLITPLIRVLRTAAHSAQGESAASWPQEFNYESEFVKWCDENPGLAKKCTVKYYKGLAAHTNEDAKKMFSPANFEKQIHMYTIDPTTKHLMEVYYGANSQLRKDVLVVPVMHLPPDQLAAITAARVIPIGRVQLDIDTKSYKNDAIKRQIPSAVDGQNPARRKILSGARKNGNKEQKVFQLGGLTARDFFYHHGDASLYSTITHLAQNYFGARKYPFLTGIGQFGNRHGQGPGSPRYVSVKMSPLLSKTFPDDDQMILSYVFEDGERAEPQYFVPVVPIAALESYKIVSEGWAHKSYGRDLTSVLTVLRGYLSGDPELVALADELHSEEHDRAKTLAKIRAIEHKWPLPVCTKGFKGTVRDHKGNPHSFGQYTVSNDVVTITELPIDVTTQQYIETLRAEARAKYIASEIFDRSTSTSVELVFKLRPGAYDEICTTFAAFAPDPMTEWLQLRKTLHPNLNYYSATGGVLEFDDCYLAVILYWAPLRRDLYKKRLLRERTVLELKIEEETLILKYISHATELNLSAIEDENGAAEKLRSCDFVPLNTTVLHSPGYTEDICAAVRGDGAGFNYILGLAERELLKSAERKRAEKKQRLIAELEKVNACLAENPPGMSIWRAEIGAFIAAAK